MQQLHNQKISEELHYNCWHSIFFMENRSQKSRINNNEFKILVNKGDWIDVMYSGLCKALN